VDGEPLTLSGTFTDPGTADTFTLTVNWGDGSSSEQSLGTARSFSATHTYEAAGPVTISATVADRDNATSSSSVDLVVQSSNHAPADLALEASATGANVAVNASFSDADADDSHTLTLDWGDGASTSQFLAAGTTTFTASHVYAASGTYTVTGTVTDPDGASTNATTQVSVTVASGSAANVVDEMTTLVQSFGLEWQNERWLVRKLNDLKASLVYGNTQVCSGSGQLSHILAFAQRNLADAQYAELKSYAGRLEGAAGCSATASQLPKALKTATVTTAVTSAPTPQKKDATAKIEKKTAKAESKLAAGRGSSR
jgi:PKD repeat protein